MSDAAGYKRISETFKEIVDTLTIKELSLVKIYLTDLSKKISAGNDKFLSEFGDIKHMLDNIKQAKGKHAIHFVVASGRLDVLKYLIETVKLDYDAKDKEGNNSFFTAVEHAHLQIVRYFVEQLGVSVHSTKEGEIGALHISANQNSIELVKYFLSKGCDIEKVSIYGKPLNWAVGSKSEQVTKYLLEQGADANGDTTCPAPPPLILAVDFGSEIMYEALLNAPKAANLNVKDPQGYSILHLAAQKGNLKLVEELVSKGLQVNNEVEGKTPLALAFENQKMHVVSFLRAYTKNSEQIQKKLKEELDNKNKVIPVDKQKAEEIKHEGNKLFAEKNYEQALEKYHEASTFDPEDGAIRRNLAACYLNLKKYNQALVHCHKAKISDPKNVKNLYREAQAYIGLNNLADAAATLWECSMIQPQTPFFKQEFTRYMQLAKQQHQKTQ